MILLNAFLAFDTPKPKDNEVRKCETCDNFTTLWYTEYPKRKSIIYQCLSCKNRTMEERKESLKNIDLNKLFNTES